MRKIWHSNPVFIFLSLAFLLSWPLLVYGFGWFGRKEDILVRYLFSCSGMLMISLAAFLTRAFWERKSFHDVGWKPGHHRWYFVIFLLCAFLWLGPPAFALLFGNLSWNRNISREELIVVFLSLGGLSLLAGFGEEFGWRGYLIPRWLSEPRYARLTLLAIGVIWGAWHCAIAIGPLLKSALSDSFSWTTAIFLFLLSSIQIIGASIVLSFIFGAIWLKTRSIFLCAFLHGYWIGIRDAASLLVSYPPDFRSVTLLTVLAAWLFSYQWLKRYECSHIINPVNISRNGIR